MQVEEIFIWGKKRKKNRQISLLDDYYYQTTSVANQNAGFALAHQLGDTNRFQVKCFWSQSGAVRLSVSHSKSVSQSFRGEFSSNEQRRNSGEPFYPAFYPYNVHFWWYAKTVKLTSSPEAKRRRIAKCTYSW